MTKKISIRLNNPCDQNWEELLVTESSRFCKTCKKNVIDFTGYSDFEMVSMFIQSNNKVCGRFHRSQLNRPIEMLPLSIPQSTSNKYLAALILLPFFNSSIFGQTKIDSKQDTAYVVINNENFRSGNSIQNNKVQDYIIRGQVHDSSEKVNLTGVTVLVKHKKYKTTTDNKGFFQLQLPKHYSTKNFKIIFELDGYNILTVKVQNKNETFSKDLNIFLHKSIIGLDEVIVVGGAFAEE